MMKRASSAAEHDLRWLRRLERRMRRLIALTLARAQAELLWQWRAGRSRPHDLGAPLIVSLTSHPARFPTLAATLKCLRSQTVRPDAVILWLDGKAVAKLPKSVRALAAHGIEIRSTQDLGPYTKIVPSLRAFPDAFIVTADDDCYLSPNWLARLVTGFDPARPAVICHRAHRVIIGRHGRPLSYLSWEHGVKFRETASDLMPTGVGGVLYFPGALPAEALDEDQFLSLAPLTDDLWLYWMERVAGTLVTTLGSKEDILYWPGSQAAGRYHENVKGQARNDIHIARLFTAYGLSLQPDIRRRVVAEG